MSCRWARPWKPCSCLTYVLLYFLLCQCDIQHLVILDGSWGQRRYLASVGSLPEDTLGGFRTVPDAAHVVQSVHVSPTIKAVTSNSFRIVFSVVDITCLTGAGWSNQSAIASGGPVCAHAELMAWAFSFITNATCTILIGFKAWCVPLICIVTMCANRFYQATPQDDAIAQHAGKQSQTVD
jgi:hypothetical protein